MSSPANHVMHGYFIGDSPVTDDLSGIEKNGPIKASDPPSPDSCYGVSKAFGEDLGRYYSLLHGIQFVALRIGWAAPRFAPEWIDRTNKPLTDHFRVMFVSRRDHSDAFDKAIQVDIPCMVPYAVSNNKPAVFDMSEAREIMNFHPVDDSETYFG